MNNETTGGSTINLTIAPEAQPLDSTVYRIEDDGFGREKHYENNVLVNEVYHGPTRLQLLEMIQLLQSQVSNLHTEINRLRARSNG